MVKTFVAEKVAGAVDEQGPLFRFKDSITLVLVAVVWVSAFVVTYLTGIPESAAVVVGAAGNFAALVVTRLSPGAITPSMAQRLDSVEVARERPEGGAHAKPGNWLDQERARLAG